MTARMFKSEGWWTVIVRCYPREISIDFEHEDQARDYLLRWTEQALGRI